MRSVKHMPNNVAPTVWFADRDKRDSQAYRSGFALQRHIDDAHKGDVDPKCNACAELKRKMQDCQ